MNDCETLAVGGFINDGREVHPMQSKPLKAVCLAAVALAWGGIASPATAKTYTYTFGSSSGGSYCDGVTLTTTGKDIYSGLHLNYDCDQDNLIAGGFTFENNVVGRIIEFVEVSVPSESGVAQVFYLDIKNKIFYLYQIGGGFNVYTEIGSGILIKGAPPVSTRGGVSSQHPKAGAKIEPMPSF